MRVRASSTSVADRSVATTSAPRRAASKASAPVPQPAISDASLQQGMGMGDQFKMYERTPEKVKGLKVTKEELASLSGIKA